MFDNKKGQQVLVLIMISIVIFIAAVILIQPINESFTVARNTTNLNCSSSDIGVTEQVTCGILDYSMFYFISVLIASSLALLSGKRTFTGVITTIFVYIVVVLLITPLKDFIILARDSSHLNCGVSTISIGSKMLCVVVDLWLFYFVISAIAASVAYIYIKIKKEKDE